MFKNLEQLKKYFTRIKPWAVVAAALTAGLFAYYGFAGWRYWEASQTTQSLKTQKVVLERTLREKLRGEEVMAAELEVERTEMEGLEQLFHHPQSDDMIGVVAATARQHGVVLSAISAGDRGASVQGEMKYQVQPMALIVEGVDQDVYDFFDALRQNLPTLQFETVRISGGGDAPTLANVQLSFLLSPQVVEKQEESPKGKTSKSGDPKPAANAGKK